MPVVVMGLATGFVLVHCAAGRGRSATFVAACLARSHARGDADAAESAVRAIRAGVRLDPSQRRVFLEGAGTAFIAGPGAESAAAEGRRSRAVLGTHRRKSGKRGRNANGCPPGAKDAK
ncbi:MAG: dual specificity protein phosphatase family protein [Alphaproteobacteria bacterium]|nr:dual specificity protein phosphatase family protein [Alphaproteobacteria bacterium]